MQFFAVAGDATDIGSITPSIVLESVPEFPAAMKTSIVLLLQTYWSTARESSL